MFDYLNQLCSGWEETKMCTQAGPMAWVWDATTVNRPTVDFIFFRVDSVSEFAGSAAYLGSGKTTHVYRSNNLQIVFFSETSLA